MSVLPQHDRYSCRAPLGTGVVAARHLSLVDYCIVSPHLALPMPHNCLIARLLVCHCNCDHRSSHLCVKRVDVRSDCPSYDLRRWDRGIVLRSMVSVPLLVRHGGYDRCRLGFWKCPAVWTSHLRGQLVTWSGCGSSLGAQERLTWQHSDQLERRGRRNSMGLSTPSRPVLGKGYIFGPVCRTMHDARRWWSQLRN